MNNPTPAVTERDLLDALAATQLTRAPGSKWEYSNFAMMVLSYALAKRSGKDYETLLRERLLAPLGMNDTYVAQTPAACSSAPKVTSPTPCPRCRGIFLSTWPASAACARRCPTWCAISKASLARARARSRLPWRKRRQQVAKSTAIRMGMNWNLSTGNGRTIVVA